MQGRGKKLWRFFSESIGKTREDRLHPAAHPSAALSHVNLRMSASEDLGERLKRIEELRRKARELSGKKKPGPKLREGESAYESNLRRNREASEAKTRKGQNIGPIPPVRDWDRRLACAENLELFLRTYLNRQFYLAFCDDHRKVTRKADISTIHGGLFAVAMPRGSGKTEIVKGAALKAVLYGHRRFPLAITATKEAAWELVDGIKFFLESPELFPLLLEDFPEAVYPIIALDGSTRKQGGQHVDGLRTELNWGNRVIDFPIVPPGNWIDGKTIGPSLSGGAKLRATSITGRVRGYNLAGLRPDLVVIDDPQTDETAISQRGNEKVERVLARAVMGLAGPDKKISGLMACTVIQPGDAIDRILNHDLHPEWDSERTKMLYSFPTLMVTVDKEGNRVNPDKADKDCKRVDVAKEHWEKYRDILKDYNPNLGEQEKKLAAVRASDYYAANEEEMKAGAVVAWWDRCDETEFDGLQRAMNLYFQDKYAFFAEAQNDPLPAELGELEELTAIEIASKINREPRLQIPIGATKLTAFVDVQQRLLYYVVCAWAEDFTGWVVDYGTYPDQKRPYFSYADATHTLRKLPKLEEAGAQAQLYGGLEQLSELILGRAYAGGGVSHLVSRCLIDSGYETKLVYSFCRQSAYKNILIPTKGSGIGPEGNSITDHKKDLHEIQGLEWYSKPSKESRGVRLLHIDTNFWKSFVMDRLAVPMGGRSGLSLFGEDPLEHRMFAEHLTSEYRIRTKSDDKKRSGRIVDIWRQKPGGPDNHFWDGIVGCAVAASYERVTLPDVHEATSQPRSGGARKSWAKTKKDAEKRK